MVIDILKKIIRKFIKKIDPNLQIIKDWENAGKPAPPPHIIKQHIVSEIQKNANYVNFIETGTYLGEMVEAQLHNFKKIYSIELGQKLYEEACEKFKNEPNVQLMLGDSGKVLQNILSELNEPAIFWLDGHFSEGITARGNKDCPIYEELTAIFSFPPIKHIILIDDARLFIGEFDYPTIDDLVSFITTNKPNASVNISTDIIRVTFS